MFKNIMRTSVYLFVFLSALLVAPSAHATNYLSQYSSGGGYLSEYPSGSYNVGDSSGYIRSGLTSGAGTIDRTGANNTAVLLVEPAITQAPCGIYNRAPVYPCRQVTMAWDPKASVSRTGGGLNVVPLSKLPPYFSNRLPNTFSLTRVQGRDDTQ